MLAALTFDHDFEGGDEIVVADDGQGDKHVDGHHKVDDESSPGSHVLRYAR